MGGLNVGECLELMLRGGNEMRRGNLELAAQLFATVTRAAQQFATEQESYALFPLATANLSLLAKRQGNPERATQLHQLTVATLDLLGPPPLHAGYLQLMSEVLSDLGEHKRAIPYYELCAQVISDAGDAIQTAVMLSRAGQSYCRSGLMEQGAIPLRAAIRIFRQNPGDPRMPEALLNLGNALRKRVPSEAEEAYKESATWYESRLQLEAAAPAWVNLGILCSENGRHEEALGWYGRVLEVRRRSPRTPPERMASLYNNIANCHRRRGEFAEADAQALQAIELLERAGAGDHARGRLLASAYHSRALIFAGQGRDEEALEWFRKAQAQRQSLPSPSLEETAVDLTEIVAVLERLGRSEEAQGARAELDMVRETQWRERAAEVDLSGLGNGDDGALQVELDHPARTRELANEIVALGRRLGDALRVAEAGFFSGTVTIPEATTLMFYGKDAETLFRVLEPSLRSEPLTRTARVTLRQGTQVRELTLETN